MTWIAVIMKCQIMQYCSQLDFLARVCSVQSSQHYSNIEHDAIRILHGLEEFYYYCFMRDICIITNHKPLVAILNTNTADTSTWKILLYELSCKPLELVGADVFSINNNKLSCIINYYSKFPLIKKANGLSEDDLIRTGKLMFESFGYHRK